MSSYTYNTGVPAQADDPAVDQPIMLANTVSISGLINQDHQGFNNTLGGIHRQLRMKAQGAPGQAPGDGVYYVNTDSSLPGGLAWPFYQNSGGSHLLVGPSNNATNNGFIMIGDYMFQWGKTTQNGGTVNFSPAYSTSPYFIGTSISSSVPSAQLFVYVSSISTGNFGVVTTANGSATSLTFYWYALGLR